MIHMDITLNPTPPPPVEKVKKVKTPKLKFKWSWRTRMLAKPSQITPKFDSSKSLTVLSPQIPEDLDEEVEFRSNQMANPSIRYLTTVKKNFKHNSEKFQKKMNRRIEESWNSIYNFYSKQLRDRKIRAIRMKERKIKEKKKAKSRKTSEQIERERMERQIMLSKPKPIHRAPKSQKLVKLANPKGVIKSENGKVILTPKELDQKIEFQTAAKKWKPLDELLPYVSVLAEPKEYHTEPPKDFTIISPHALTYEITPEVLKLSELPERKKKRPSLPQTGVNPRALKAKLTPRIEELAKPSLTVGGVKKQDEDKAEGWTISPGALKYKATPRILELAKPIERD